MIASSRAATVCTAASSATTTHGDNIWEALTDRIRIGRPFSLDDARDILLQDFPHLKPRTLRDYIKAVLYTVEDEGKETGDPQVWRVSSRYWKL